MNHAPHILVVDDDDGITALLCDYLATFGFVAHSAGDGAAMRRQLDERHIDLVVLDLQLPGMDGLALAQELRHKSRIPIVMLTARGNPIDRVIGLEMGADDYMSKPFEPRELVARIHTVLRRVKGGAEERATEASGDFIRFDGWELHRSERRLTSPKGLVVPLSNAEFQLLSTFLKTPRRLFTRDQLMSQARGRSMESVERSIDLLVSRLRQKLDDNPRDPTMIKTVRGEGYVFNVQTVQGQASWPAH
ncbi:response regulator [Aquabacterium sp.]|uniref:response regulator n=1 Tax=Aquabacterium sp. TaxID=1872578 RepID=UPI003D6CDB1B